MTFSKDQVQALVAEIDSVLQKPTSRLPWMSGEAMQQRRVLERVRNYLVALQKHLPIAPERSLSRTDLLSYDISYQPAQASAPANPQNAQQMLQVVMQEMAHLRSSLMQPLQADLNAMQQQREALRQEIQQLEGQRRSYSLAPGNQSLGNQPLGNQPLGNQQLVINEFLQVLMERLQESLPQQVAQSLRGTSAGSALAAGPSFAYESVEQLRSPHAQSDQLILNLDSTLRVVFEALQRDVTAYQDSLAQGLDRMHSLGQQSEMMFNALITHLAQQLGREASTYLQASGQLPDPKIAAAPGYPSLPPNPPAPPPAPSAEAPFPGAELSPAAGPPESSSVDRAIDSWLQSMSSPGSVSGAALQPPSSQSGRSNTPAPDLNLSASAASADRPTEDPTEIDAALRLLQQLSANLDSSTAAPTAPAAPGPAIDMDGLDEFYELFGGDLDAAVPPSAPPAVLPSAPAIAPSSLTSPALSSASLAAVDSLTGGRSGQASSFAGIEASGSFDPTHGWDLLSDQPAPPSTGDRPGASSSAIAAANQIRSLDDLFEDLPSLNSLTAAPAQAPVAPIAPTPIAPVSSTPVAPIAPTPVAPIPSIEEQEPLFITDDDRYIPAAPEENLLPSPDQREAPHQEFWLDDLSLSRLSEDLFSLEAGGAALPPDRAEAAIDGFEITGLPETGLTATANVGHPAALPEALPANSQPASPEAARSNQPVAPQLSTDRTRPLTAPAGSTASGAANQSFDQSFAFSLDDLFDTEALPPSATTAAASTPPASVSDSFAFTLEGMDDLFADTPAPTPTPIPPPDSSAPTIDEPLGFTLEGMDDLFANLPAPEPTPPEPDPPESKTPGKPPKSTG